MSTRAISDFGPSSLSPTMRASSLFVHATVGFAAILNLASFLSVAHFPVANAISFASVLQPVLDLSPLGRVALTGSFDAASIYSYTKQSENVTVDNIVQSLSTPLPNGLLANISSTDGQIRAVCPFTRKDGTYVGLFVAGNFSNLGGVKSQGVALCNTTSGAVTALQGLRGSVSALLCDQETDQVYVGGDFTVNNTSNAAAWVGDGGWSVLPFGGLNGPVSSIVKEANGHIVFGGSFDGVGNTTSATTNEQVINLQTANISADAQSSIPGFRDPRNIICQTSGQAGPGKTYLLHDYAPGFWRANMRFAYRPSKLRLYNTHLDGRGTKTFLFRALPINGILNLTYTDPDTGNTAFCDVFCPLSNNPNVKFQDFTFVNSVVMDGFQIEISGWYGKGAGLDGIELFEDGIFTYAVNDFNEPSCANNTGHSQAILKGAWDVTPDGQNLFEYMTAHVTDLDATSTSVTFEPDIKQSGKYAVLLYTPGCEQDGTCSSRGIVNVTVAFASQSGAAGSVSTMVYQTNDFDKYDVVYTGLVDASSGSFRPSVTLTPLANQGNNLTVVASKVQFEQLSLSAGLNSLFDYDPTSSKTTANFTQSAVDQAGLQLNPGASVLSLTEEGGVTYAGGNFSGPGINNIMFFKDQNATALPQGGLNGQVDSMLLHGGFLYVGGSFTDTSDGGNSQLQHVAAYSLTSKTWSSLGGGVNGRVTSILPLPMNVSTEINETTIAISGNFDQTLAFGTNSASAVLGIAVWVPSAQNWLHNLNITHNQLSGQLSAIATANKTVILAGSMDSDGMAAGDVVTLVEAPKLSVGAFSLKVTKSDASSGIYSGIFDTSSGRNLTIFGGHFNASASDGSMIQNLVVLNGADGAIAGLSTNVDSNSTILALTVFGNTLFAGGNITGTAGQSTLNGFMLWDIPNGRVAQSQPAPLNGSDVSVNSIAARPGSSEVYFGGNFDAAGNLPCPSVCFWEIPQSQWSRPGAGLTGTVLALYWASEDLLFAVGNLTVNGNQTTVATYNAKKQVWSSFQGASSPAIDGTVTAFSPAIQDMSRFWLAGQSPNGSAFLVNYNGTGFQSVENMFDTGTRIESLEVMAVSNDHGSSALLNQDQVLLVTGKLVIPDFGDASAAFFNGSALVPFILSSKFDGKPGSISGLFSERTNTFRRHSHHYSNGIVVLISFCIALGCVFLIVACGVILNKIQRRRQGYVAAPQSYGTDRPSPMRRVPPEYLFNTLNQRNPGVPAL